MHSHYGSEFFCPISLFRIYGLSEFEVIDTAEEPEEQEEPEVFLEAPAEKKPKGEAAVKASQRQGLLYLFTCISFCSPETIKYKLFSSFSHMFEIHDLTQR